jgi:hypothetical protein
MGVLRKQSGNEDQHCREPQADAKIRKTMEFIVNTVVLSTDHARRGARHVKKAILKPMPRPKIELNLPATTPWLVEWE